MANTDRMDYVEHNRKIAKMRGSAWKQKLREAKLRQKGENYRALAVARFDKGFTQKDMMNSLGTNNNTIYARIERGDVTTNQNMAERISHVLNKRVDELFIEVDKGRFLAI